MSAFDDFKKDILGILLSKRTPTELYAPGVPTSGQPAQTPGAIGPAAPFMSGEAHEHATITSDMGRRTHPITGEKEKMHEGVDIAGLPAGATAHAINDGVISFAGTAGGFGNLVILSYVDSASNTHDIKYGHLASISVRKGQEVKKGQVVGVIGATGGAKGIHLHLEHLINKVKHRAADFEIQTAVNAKSLIRRH
jgi:murein DD-endopeptidase MepM/ murein hydrolase activator NlpD